MSPDELITSNLDLAETQARILYKTSCAKINPYIIVDDLYSYAYEGLMDAARKYEPSKGKFEVYAKFRINGAILDGLRSQAPNTRTDRNVIKKVRAAERAIRSRESREPLCSSEIALELGITLDEYRELESKITARRFIVHDPDNFGDMLEEEMTEAVESSPCAIGLLVRDEERLDLLGVIQKLKPVQGRLIVLRYFEDKSFKEIAETLKLSESRCSRIHTEAINALKKKLS